MVWQPDWKWNQMQQQKKGGGKGGPVGGPRGGFQQPKQSGKGGKASSGKGGGKKRQQIRDTSKVVWIGDLPEGVTFKELKEHGQQAGEPKWAEILGKSQGVIGYGSEEEAQDAIAILTGTVLNGAAITADVWEKKTKE
mmetsp:Transcript_12231/g.16571  ORF Transcript_12231/g.16571 Transcript_12231/m.16571 type:complete len:138 (-) Transcript_12231:128-541(-)